MKDEYTILNKDEHTILNKDVEQIIKFQSGPIQENGVNGCQVEDLLLVCLSRLKDLNDILPCDENVKAIGHINLVLGWLDLRTKNRELRGVEGTSLV